MKKLLLAAGIVLLSLTAQAQEKSQGLKGAWWATAQFGYQQTKTGDTKGTNLTVLPIAGYFVTPSVTVGAGVGMINMKAEDATGTLANTNLLVVEPLVRKYWNVAGNFYFFGQLAAPIITGKEKEAETKISQFGLAMSGGIDFFVTKNFSVEFSYDLANFTSTTIDPATGDKTTITNFSLAHVASAESVYIDNLGGSLPNLTTPLSFGFKFIF
ncbi:outer membrane beta-barrel protein [Flavobacterium paronense]|uniref:Outer membrane beta-barrel protein n=1 Tax=Flavobacterium paronense TaxID=1392775 RepID=A0ABV5GGL6_9FLAO|nr:outer membrane beta-barrel protein [Flavobacterium paronense]MDN3677143.1 outer membrane beta-barrel protein [Flavobacterium paronense]